MREKLRAIPAADAIEELSKLKWIGMEERKKMTNADKIRAMSDEELADYLRYYSDSYARYDMDWLDWLKQEVERDG